MSDVVRCKCPHDSAGTRCGRAAECAIHGVSSQDPQIDWKLTHNDKEMLQSFRIGTKDDSAAIQKVREADESRFNPPRNV